MNAIKLEKIFRSESDCISHLERIRWANGDPMCLRCGAEAWKHSKRHLYECSNCSYQFSIRKGTVFEKSHLSLTLWFRVIYLMCQSKKGISALQIKRMFGIHYKSAWYLCMRIRNCMKTDPLLEKLSGTLEIDEVYLGGKRKDGQRGRPGYSSHKIPVMGMIQRDGKVVVRQVGDVTKSTIKRFVDEWAGVDVEIIYSDELSSYNVLKPKFKHKQINHSVSFVEGDVHTNGIENFWSLLKRGMIGTFHKVSVRHLQRYLNEFAFRFNGRNLEDLMKSVLENCLIRHESYREMIAST